MIDYGTDYPDAMTDDGAALLDDVHEFLVSYVAFPSYAAGVAATLWAAHTHLVGECQTTPRLALLSPEKQCGKTRVLELLELLCPGARRLSNASPSYMFRRIERAHKAPKPDKPLLPITVLIDEADAIWKGSKADESKEALRSIVNDGHRKGGLVGRSDQYGKLYEFNVYAPIALAGIGENLPDTIIDRSVVLRMRRRAPDEHVTPYRERETRPEGEALRDRLARWADTVREKVGCPWPDMPTGVEDRPADVWEPLLMVADLAGGDWPNVARDACRQFVTSIGDDTETTGVRLLKDLKTVFGGAEKMSSGAILTKLHGLDESSWAEFNYGRPLDPRGLAKLLKPYGAKPKVLKTAPGVTGRGYERDELQDAWTRYL